MMVLDAYKQGIARHFDSRTSYARSDSHARLADRLVRLAAPQPGEQVLDVATGTGFVAISVAQLVGPRGRVVGVDISAGMLSQAAQAISAADVHNVELVQSDAESLDFPAGGFDLICCCNALPYMADVPAALRIWHSLLRPGGRLVFNCWAAHSYATGHLLRTVAARHGIRVALVGRDTGTPQHCRAALTTAGFVRAAVTAEATAEYLSADQLEAIPQMAAMNPLYGITPGDASRLKDLRDEYLTESRSTAVRNGIEAETGAYFVVAYKLAESAA